MLKRITLAAALVLGLARFEAGADEARLIRDMNGRAVTLPQQIVRAIGTGGAVDAWFVMLGVREKLVGTSRQLADNAWLAKIDPAIARLPLIYSDNRIDRELLAASRPQAALLLSGVAAREQIEKTGVPIVMFERETPEQMQDAIELAGQVLGAEALAQARAYRAYFQANIARIRHKTSGLPTASLPRVYYAASDPLITEGGRSIVTSWIELAGGRNVAADAGAIGLGQSVQLEDLLHWNPEIIIAFTPSVRDQILLDPRWQGVDAVRNHRVVVNPRGVYPWSTRSAEVALQTLWAARTIHPELFSDIDLTAETRAFHRRFYRYDLTDDEAGRMLAAQPPAY